MISPSSFERRMLCPGSEREEAKAPRGRPRPYAERGNKLHAVMAELCETGISKDLERGYLEPEDDAAVRWTWDQVRPSIEDARRLGWPILVEHRLDLTHLGMNVEEDPERIRLDLAIVAPDMAFLWDFKFGDMYVPRPKFNPQFRLYALGLVGDFGVPSVQATRLQYAALEDYRVVTDTLEAFDLMALEKKAKDVAAACSAPDAPLVIGSKQCQFCAARDSCPARAGAVMGMPLHLGVPEHLRQMEPADRRDFYERVLVAYDWITRARGEIEAYILEGGEMPGFGIGDGRGRRVWQDEDVALAALRNLAVSLGRQPDALVTRVVASPSQAEKILGTKKGIREEIAKLVTTKPGNKQVVRLEPG